MTREDDMEFEDYVLTDVRDNGNWYTLEADGMCLSVQANDVVPRKGDTARYYGRGFGFPVRGVEILGKGVIYYRTPEQEEAKRKEDAAARDAERRAQFERNRAKMDATYDALPPEFRRRIDRFRAHDQDFRAQGEGYEVVCCVDAVKIAAALKTREEIRAFGKKSWAEQNALVPGLDDGHSGNTFGMACRLAWLYVGNPELVEKEHAAICPLRGCKESGCWAASEEAKASA